MEPEGRDIHVDTVRTEVWQPAYRTAPEPGRKVFLVREADRLSPPAADTLLKVLEEPPADAVIVLLSARAHELRETVLSRCHVVTFTALPEVFVVDELVRSGADEVRARLAARLAGGNLGRARRLAGSEEGLRFRDAARAAIELAARAPPGRSRPPMSSCEQPRTTEGHEGRARRDLAPFLDERGRPRRRTKVVRRIEVRFQRRERRAERDYVDWVLLGVSALLRDAVAAEVGGGLEVLLNPDLAGEQGGARLPRRPSDPRHGGRGGGARRARGRHQPEHSARAGAGIPPAR